MAYVGLKKNYVLNMINLAKSINGNDNFDDDDTVQSINRQANDPGFEYFSDQQMIHVALGMVLENNAEDNQDTMKNCMSHHTALSHADIYYDKFSI